MPLEKTEPIIVAHLFPEILDHLLELLSSLEPQEWERPTACAYWTVKDLAQHLLGDDIGLLSRARDGYSQFQDVSGWGELVALIDASNELWVSAMRRISPALLCDLLRFTGDQINAYFHSLNPHQMGGPVSWAGPDPAPVWLDLAREYTERWLHQQHIREALGRPGLFEPRFFNPVLAAFVHGAPRAYRDVPAPPGTHVALTISGDSGGQWAVLRGADRWSLYRAAASAPTARVIIPQDVAWRLFTRGLSPEQALPKVSISGDRELGLRLLDTVAIIA